MRIAIVLAVLAVSWVASADVAPPFEQDEVLTIPNDPQVTSMAWAPDDSGRLFLTAKTGRIWIIKNRALLATPAYTFTPRADDNGGELVTDSECGLLGLAFDPDFTNNRFIYVFATLHVPATSINVEQQIIRFTMQGDTAIDRVTLIAGLPTRGRNHDGGALAFGPDGLLYWGVGNTGGAGVGQGSDLESPGSKIGRTRTELGAPPPPGPYNDGSGPNYDYTFARSLRNPFTMAFHPITGAPWVSVVGDDWEQVFSLSLGDHIGYPAENVEPGTSDATVSPLIAYATGTSPDVGVAANSAVRMNNVVTVTTVVPHRLRKGGEVIISGIDDASFDGVFTIAGVPTPTMFTYGQVASAATSGNGVARGGDYGSVVLGGTFYDATQFPIEYRQNFFFGDFGSGELVRVETAADATVSRISRFGTNAGRHIDATTGPDGALWIVNHDGVVRRIAYTSTSQTIVLSPQNLRFPEGGRGVIGISLAMQPASDVAVTLSRASGSQYVNVTTNNVTFTPTNWSTPQFVEVTSAIDADLVEDLATFDASASGIATETVTVRVTDTREPLPPAADDVPATDGPSAKSGGCCGVSRDAASVGLLSLVVGGLLRRRRSR